MYFKLLIFLEQRYSTRFREGICQSECISEIHLFDNTIKQNCAIDVQVHLMIETKTDISMSEEKQTITFACDYNLCNSNQTVSQIQHLVDNYYDISPLRQVLANRTAPNTTTIASTDMTSTTYSTTSSPITNDSSTVRFGFIFFVEYTLRFIMNLILHYKYVFDNV